MERLARGWGLRRDGAAVGGCVGEGEGGRDDEKESCCDGEETKAAALLSICTCLFCLTEHRGTQSTHIAHNNTTAWE